MQNTVINGDALKRTLVLMVGLDATQVIEKTYEAINSAQEAAFSAGYNSGVRDGHSAGYTFGQERAEERISDAFDNGWMFGQSEAEDVAEDKIEVTADMSYDEGYLNGVADARVRPSFADDTVQAIINEAAAAVFSAEEDISGDEDALYDEVMAGYYADYCDELSED